MRPHLESLAKSLLQFLLPLLQLHTALHHRVHSLQGLFHCTAYHSLQLLIQTFLHLPQQLSLIQFLPLLCLLSFRQGTFEC